MTDVSILLPKGWVNLAYSKCVENIILTGKKTRQKDCSLTGKYPVVDQGNELIGGYFDESARLVDCQLPVVVFGDHTRAVKYIQFNFIPGADGIKVLEPKCFIEPKLLYYFTQYLASKIRGKGYARHYQWLAKEGFNIPPCNEQSRIVAKIEELFSEIDKGVESLEAAKTQLQVYRQALLKHAFEGKLTAQWRADNPDKVVPAKQLLEQIKQAREERYQQQLADWRIAVEKWEFGGKEGKKPSKPSALKKKSDIISNENNTLFSLPKSWRWECFSNVYTESVLGKMLDKSKNKGIFQPYLRNVNVRWFHFELSDLLEMRFEEREFERYSVRKGDLIVCEGGEPGRCAVWSDESQQIFIQKALHRIRFSKDLVSPFYILNFIKFAANQGLLKRYFTGTTIKHLTGASLSKLPIPLCSYWEQLEIVRSLEKKLDECQHLENDIDVSLTRAESLRQSILKQAFSGKLVPQDPNDEPASELLARIKAEKAEKAEREAQTKANKTKKPRTRCKTKAATP